MMASSPAELPSGYAAVLAEVKAEIRTARRRAQRVVNTELISLYWRIGRAINAELQSRRWGTGATDRLADDLRREFPNMRGLSGRNLRYMTGLAKAWPEPIWQQPAAKLPWGHIMVLLDKLDSPSLRDWYAAKAVEEGWSRKVLLNQIMFGLHQREGVAPANFETRLVDGDSELAQQLTKDPYVFEFLDLAARKQERDVEQALMNRLQDTLLEFGRGFAFVGRQVRLDVDGDEFFVDLLLFHVVQLRYVVVELKIGRFKPEYTGQLGFYVAVVDDKIRDASIHAPTVGLLLCASRNESAVRYALGASSSPMAVANYGPAAQQLSLPTPDEFAALVEEELDQDDDRSSGGHSDG